MGAFDLLSDSDPRVIAHEEAKLRSQYGTRLSDYTIPELKAEIKRQLKEQKELKKAAKNQLKVDAANKVKRIKELKEELAKLEADNA